MAVHAIISVKRAKIGILMAKILVTKKGGGVIRDKVNYK